MSKEPIFRILPAPLLVLAALAVPSVAHAGKVVLAPLLADETINAKQRLAVHQLIASELDFAPEVSGVVDLDVAPPTLNDACIAAAKCLGGITTANGGEQMVSGRMSGSGGNFVLDLVFYDGTQIARRKAFTVPQDPTSLANAMTPIVRELLTGAGVDQKAAASAGPSTDFEDDEDLSMGTGVAMGDGLVDVTDEEPMAAAPVPVPVAAKKTTPPPAPPVEPASKKASKDDQRRLAAASAATGLAAGVAAGTAASGASTAARTAPPPPPPAPVAAAAPPAPADDDLAKMISFGGSASDITAEDISMIQFGAPPGVGTAAPMPAPVVVERPAPASGASDTRLAEEEAELEKLTDLDQGSKRTAPPAGSGGGPKTGGGGGELGHIVQFTLRGGYSRYYTFDFFTGGGEAAVAVAGGLHLVAGVEVYAVERILPPELQISTGIYSQWNFIFPGNLGVIYKFPLGMAQPYVGADTIFVQYYKDAIGADWAIGGRIRAGVDLLVIPNFGFNLNLAFGGWSGQNWGLIEQGVGKAGILPQVSLGAVVAF